MANALLVFLACLVSTLAAAAEPSGCDAEKNETVRFACQLSTVLYGPEGYDFKGIKLGSHPSLIEKDSRFTCEVPKNLLLGEKMCQFRPDQQETFAGVPLRDVTLLYYDDYLFFIYVEFSTAAFEQVLRAMSEQWGAPAGRSTITAKTRSGVSYRDVQVRWRTAGAYINLLRDSRDPEMSELRFGLIKGEQEMAKRQAPPEKKAVAQAPAGEKEVARASECPVINGTYSTIKQSAGGGTAPWHITLSTRVEQGVVSYTVDPEVANFQAADGVARPYRTSRGRPGQNRLSCANGALTHETWMDEDMALTRMVNVYKVVNAKQFQLESNVSRLSGTYTFMDPKDAPSFFEAPELGPSRPAAAPAAPPRSAEAQGASPLEDTLAYLNARLRVPRDMRRELLEAKGGTLCRIWELNSGGRYWSCLNVGDIDTTRLDWRQSLVRMLCLRPGCVDVGMNGSDGTVTRNPPENELILDVTRDQEDVERALRRLFGLM